MRPEAVLKVGRIYHRDDPIIIGQPPAKPTYPGRQTDLAQIAALWDLVEAAGVPNVTGVWKLLGGGIRLINVISIKQSFAGHAKMAGLAVLGNVAGAFLSRIVIVVDDDIDITNPDEVEWAVTTRVQHRRDIYILPGGQGSRLDPSSDESGVTDKLLVDATRKRGFRGRVAEPTKETMKKVESRWKQYGFK